MKQLLLVVAMLGVFGASVALGYFFYGKTGQQTQVSDNASETAVADVNRTTVPNAAVGRVEPVNQLGVVLEYGMEIVPGQNFTEGVFEEMVVKQVRISGNRGVLVLDKNGVEVELPVVGVLGVRKTVGGESETAPVRDLGRWLEAGEKLRVRTGFVGSNVTMTWEEITRHYEEKLKDYELFGEMMEANRLWGVKRLSEDEFVARLGGNPVRFEAEELIALSVEVVP